jgi:hypothetical protein
MNLLSSVFNKLRRSTAVVTNGEPPSESVTTDSVTAPTAPPRAKRKIQAPPPRERKELDVAQIMRWRRADPPWQYREIAAKLGVGVATIYRRVEEYEAAHAAAKPTQASIVPVPEPAAEPAFAVKLEASRRNIAAKKKPEPPTATAAPAAVISQPVQPSEPMTSIVTNYDDLRKRRPTADMSHVFLVRPEHLKYGLGGEQPVIAFARWYVAYSQLEIIQAPVQFYVVIHGEDGHAVNRAWLSSIAKDTAMMQRCIVTRIEHGNLVPVFRARYDAQSPRPANSYGARLADEEFQRMTKFVPLPQDRDALDKLAADAKPIDVPQLHPADKFPKPPQAGEQRPPTIGPRRCAGGFIIDANADDDNADGYGAACTG